MKRGGEIKRRASRRTPEQVAAAMTWHRETLAQPTLICTAGESFTGIVMRGEAHAYHVIPQQTLRRKARDLGMDEDALVWDARVGVPLSKRRHERHHTAVEPLRWNELPADRQYFLRMFAIKYGLEGWLARHVPGFE